MESMSIRMGLIGAGRMGKVFAHTLAFNVAEVDLVAIADSDPASAAVAAGFGVDCHYADYQELLGRADIQAVVIATPTSTHAQVIQDAASAGKHIFSEKPLAMTLEMCDEAIAAVRQAGVKLQLGFMRRFDAAYALAKKKIDEGAIGQPVVFHAISRDKGRTSLEFARRENSGGMIMDMGVHDFDLARWLMGSEVVRVQTEGDCLVYPELKEVGDIDNALINLRFANNAVGNIDLSRNAIFGYDIRTEVLGSEGALQIGTLQQTATLTLTSQGISHDTIPGFMERFGDAYAAEIRGFVASVLEDREPSVTGEDARKATAIGMAATRSLDEARPVMLSEIG
jgi:inositol 2-dehydrogenase